MRNKLKEEPLRILIAGKVMSGKTTMAVLLAEFLTSKGMQVQLLSGPHHPGWEPEGEARRVWETLDVRVENMKGKPVYIEMTHVHRHADLSAPATGNALFDVWPRKAESSSQFLPEGPYEG
jgi:hypothetical protein